MLLTYLPKYSSCLVLSPTSKMHSSSKLLTRPLSKPGPLPPSPAIWYPAQAGRSRGIESFESFSLSRRSRTAIVGQTLSWGLPGAAFGQQECWLKAWGTWWLGWWVGPRRTWRERRQTSRHCSWSRGWWGPWGEGGTAPPWLGLVSVHALLGPGKYVYMSLHPKTGAYCHRHGEVGAMHSVCSF